MGEVVHHVDRQAHRARPFGHRRTQLAGAGTQHGDRTMPVVAQRIAVHQVDLRSGRLTQRDDLLHRLIACAGVPTDARAGRQQHPQFRQRKLALPHQNDGPRTQIQKHRQETHGHPLHVRRG